MRNDSPTLKLRFCPRALSRRVTWNPRFAYCRALKRPTIPAPMMATSASVVRDCSRATCSMACPFSARDEPFRWPREVTGIPPGRTRCGKRAHSTTRASALAVERAHLAGGVAGAGDGLHGHGGFQGLDVLRGQLHVERAQGLGELLALARADDGHDVLAP